MKTPRPLAATLETPANVTTLNGLLARMGEPVRVARHWDACSLYFYSAGDSLEVENWFSSTVCVARASDLTIAGWLRELAELRTARGGAAPLELARLLRVARPHLSA